MLFYDCLEEFQLDCTLRKLSIRTVKGYYNNTHLFLTFLEMKCDIRNTVQKSEYLNLSRYGFRRSCIGIFVVFNRF